MSSSIEDLSEKWSHALVSNDLDLALETAMKGYMVARNDNDQVHIMLFLGFIRHASEKLFEKHSERKTDSTLANYTCSFCAKSGKKLKLMRSPIAAICSDCIALASKTLD